MTDPADIRCVSCGCTENNACVITYAKKPPDACHWLRTNDALIIGLCSAPACHKFLRAWDKAVAMAKKSGTDFQDCLKFAMESSKTPETQTSRSSP